MLITWCLPVRGGPTSIYYGDWMAHRAFVQAPMQVFAAKWLESFKDFPLCQRSRELLRQRCDGANPDEREQGLTASSFRKYFG